MLEAVFKDQGAFVLVAAAAVLAAALAGYLLARRYARRPWSCAGLAAALTAELGVTLFLPSPGGVFGECVVNRDLGEPFATEQGLLNVAMFLPLGFLGVLALRRVVPVLLGAVLLSVVTELGQGLVPWIGRSCDSSDVQMNVLGAALGALAGAASVRAARRELCPLTSALGPALLAFGAGVLACGVVAGLWITPVIVDSTSLRIAGRAEKDAARQAVSTAFDDHEKIANVQVMPRQDGGSARLLIALKTGSAELSWPDREEFSADFWAPPEPPGPSGYPVPGAPSAAPESAEDALRTATLYAKERFPWALSGSTATSTPVGPQAESGWVVAWRGRTDGVVAPTRLDVRIDREGHVVELLARHVEDAPTTFPPRRVSERQGR
ncbi:VanZ family protein, partial [Streptomyces sp. NRRL WC-3549]|uniref:VanZ family protein n=1 Tax=Streptomyces sp. NRRL WC-3549 TaxID=1463925 RepID=UPI0007C7C8FB